MKKNEKRKMLLLAAADGVAVRHKLCQNLLNDIIDMAQRLSRVLKKGGTIYLAGNGGSAADCEHFATELVVRLTGKFQRPSLPAVSLTANSSLLTAAGNDYGFDKIFSRQVESLVSKKDALVVISTSGNSANLITAAKAARKKKAEVYSLLGSKGGKLKRYSDYKLIIPSNSVQRIQEEHIFIIHNLVYLIERDLFS
ncbi:MAG: SIS domain-containing protein [candidate division Zixibacteria bacterium]